MTENMISRRAVLAGIGGIASLSALDVRAFAQEKVFRVGAPNAITGAGGAFGTGVQKTIIAAAQRINDAGGAGGYTFEIFAEDSQTLPEPALLASKKLIEVNSVRALMGVHTSPETLAVLPVTNAADVVLMHTGAAPKIAEENRQGLAFGFYPSSDSIGYLENQICEREGFQTPVTLTLTNDASIGNTAAFWKYWQAKNPDATPNDVQYQPNQPNYRSELQNVMMAAPDVIFVNGYEPDATIILKQLYELGNGATIVAPDFAITSRLIESLGGDVVEGAFVYRFVPDVEAPAFKEYDAMYQELTGKPGTSNSYGAIAFDQMTLMALALEMNPGAASGVEIAGTIHEICGPDGEPCHSFAEGKALIAGGAKRLNYMGASGPCDFDEKGRTPGNFGVSAVTGETYEPKYTIVFEG